MIAMLGRISKVLKLVMICISAFSLTELSTNPNKYNIKSKLKFKGYMYLTNQCCFMTITASYFGYMLRCLEGFTSKATENAFSSHMYYMLKYILTDNSLFWLKATYETLLTAMICLEMLITMVF